MSTAKLMPPTAAPARLARAPAPPPSRVGVRQIAELCRVSRSTAALALKNSPRVTSKLRAEIQAVARRLGYAPNPYVSDVMSSIARGRWRARGRTLAIVVHGPSAADASVRALCRAIEAAGETLGAAVSVLHLRDVTATEALARVIEVRGISGVVLVGFDVPPPLEDRLPDLPFVTVGGSPARSRLTAIGHDRGHALQLVEERVRALGYVRPFLLAFAADGVTGAHETLGGAADLHRLTAPDLTQADLPGRVRCWLTERQPDVVFGFGAATQALVEMTRPALPYVDLEHAADNRCFAAMLPDFDTIARLAVETVMTAGYAGQQARTTTCCTILVPGHLRAHITGEPRERNS